ncbi:MAG: glycosyltransferase [Candidatus Omnitrophota bacterium]|nr:MAG: glycosyltransferase [Candidatus Omnitrophota bacterium]
MRIAILVQEFPPQRAAGTEIATYNTAKHLVRKGHDVYVITSFYKGSNVSVNEGFYVQRIIWPRVRFVGIILYWVRAFVCLRKINPDIVHTQSIFMGITGFLAKVFFKKPYVMYGRGSDIYLPWVFKRPISRLILKNADAVIAQTEDMKVKMQKIYNRDIFVVPNGIDLEKFKGILQREMRDKAAVVILFVGRLIPVKGVRYLIEAIKILKQKNLNTKLILIGDGKDRLKLAKLVEKLGLNIDITFLGKINNEDIPKYMVNADVFILPSLSEGFPMVILEAFASGLPIIATKVGGISEIIKEGVNGFLVKPRDPEAIAERVIYLLQDDHLKNKIIQENIRESNLYSWNKVTQELEAIYSQIIKHN